MKRCMSKTQQGLEMLVKLLVASEAKTTSFEIKLPFAVEAKRLKRNSSHNKVDRDEAVVINI
jgi:hypothetical protein